MFLIDTIILLGGVLLLLGIASSKFSARLGLPVLVLFLALGMLAGSEGIGRIPFQNYELAHGIGTLALALILFDGGLSTPLASIRAVWKPSLLLATVGVAITAAITGWAASWVLGVPLYFGLLLGSIVGSTDAAAVFAVLRSGGVHLSDRLASTLEIESGSNDPMAIFLTVGLIEIIAGKTTPGWGLLDLFLTQMLVGGVAGLGVGVAAVHTVNRLNLNAAGLYPVLISAFGLLSFGLAANMSGSGFLAIYISGIVIGNSRIVFKRGILLFHDAGAWMGQIIMFVVLGLLSFPSRLLSVTGQGLLIAAALVFIARPVAVLLTIPWFRFNWREITFISWVGLKGAVPITLATFPFLLNVERSQLLFDVVFFVVVISAVVQGWSLPSVARMLKLEVPAPPQPPVTVEISSLHQVDGDVVDFAVAADSRAAGRRVKELALPEGVVIALIARNRQLIPPQGNTRIEAGDHVVLVVRSETLPLLNRVFSRQVVEHPELPPMLEFPLRARVTIGDLEEVYGISLDAPAESTLDEAIRSQLADGAAAPGQFVALGPIGLYVRAVSSRGTIESVGMVMLTQPAAPDHSQAATKDVPSESTIKSASPGPPKRSDINHAAIAREDSNAVLPETESEGEPQTSSETLSDDTPDDDVGPRNSPSSDSD